MSITLAQICNAVETTLGAATGLTYTQSYNELKEGMNDTPTLQVYWNSISGRPERQQRPDHLSRRSQADGSRDLLRPVRRAPLRGGREHGDTLAAG